MLYLVVGLGKTGFSVARYLRRKNQSFMVFDTRQHPPDLAAFRSEFPHIKVFHGEPPPKTLYSQLIAIICSPGIALEHPFFQKALAMNIPIYGDIECLAGEVNVPIIAITGTNGKSTVTTLVAEMAKAANLSVAIAGNIGLPVLDILALEVQYDVWVLELSSFQLELLDSLKPLASTILNVTTDHLDRHHSLDHYTHAKQKIYRQARTIVYNREDRRTFPQSHRDNTITISFGLDVPQGKNWGIITDQGKPYLSCGSVQLMAVDALCIKGQHNWLNALAACALANVLDIAPRYMVEVLQRFPGLPHRTQWVRSLNHVAWINDSKGTNVGATISAISGIGASTAGKIILIAGGQGKGADFSKLRTPVAKYVRSLILFGADADMIEKALAGTVPITRVNSLEDAVLKASFHAHPGDLVLLSPACASLDMFKDFNHRGDIFMTAVNAL